MPSSASVAGSGTPGIVGSGSVSPLPGSLMRGRYPVVLVSELKPPHEKLTLPSSPKDRLWPSQGTCGPATWVRSDTVAENETRTPPAPIVTWSPKAIWPFGVRGSTAGSCHLVPRLSRKCIVDRHLEGAAKEGIPTAIPGSPVRKRAQNTEHARCSGAQKPSKRSTGHHHSPRVAYIGCSRRIVSTANTTPSTPQAIVWQQETHHIAAPLVQHVEFVGLVPKAARNTHGQVCAGVIFFDNQHNPGEL